MRVITIGKTRVLSPLPLNACVHNMNEKSVQSSEQNSVNHVTCMAHYKAYLVPPVVWVTVAKQMLASENNHYWPTCMYPCQITNYCLLSPKIGHLSLFFKATVIIGTSLILERLHCCMFAYLWPPNVNLKWVNFQHFKVNEHWCPPIFCNHILSKI